jgi:DNA-binding response OmpR family regulator
MILIIDDEPEILKMLELTLNKQGFKVRTAHSAEEGWIELHKQKPQLLLCDINMPQSDGFILVEKVRKQPALADLRVLFMTGQSARQHSGQLESLKALGVVQKPFTIQEIVQEVEKALATPT